MNSSDSSATQFVTLKVNSQFFLLGIYTYLIIFLEANVRPYVRMSTTFRGKRDFLGP